MLELERIRKETQARQHSESRKKVALLNQAFVDNKFDMAVRSFDLIIVIAKRHCGNAWWKSTTGSEDIGGLEEE